MLGDTGTSTGVEDVAAASSGEVAQPDSSVEPEQSPAEGAGEAGQQPQTQETAQAPAPETDVTQLDLTQPENLRQFRSSYDKVKFERDEAVRARDAIQQEMQTFRAAQDRGVYITTDIPLDDFNPRESFIKMAEEEPEYYESVAADVMDTHFWSDIGDQVRSLEGVPLDPNLPADNEKLESLGVVWDSLARRMTRGQLDGDSLYDVLTILENSPDLQSVIIARLSGAQGPMPPQGQQQPGFQQGYQQPGYGQPQGVQTAEAIADQYGLDLTDAGHQQIIYQTQMAQQQRQAEQTQRQRELAQRDMQIQRLQNEVSRINQDQEGLRDQSSEDAQRRAATRLNEQLESSLDSDIQTRYGNAIPKDRPGLLGDIKTIAKAALEANPDYKNATARAEKWFKQAAAAKDPRDRDRWDKSGLDALTVVTNYRAQAISQAADRLLGPIRRTTQRQDQKTKDLQHGRREITGGTAIPPVTNRPPAPSGDIQATRDAVRARLREAQNRGMPGLPRF